MRAQREIKPYPTIRSAFDHFPEMTYQTMLDTAARDAYEKYEHRAGRPDHRAYLQLSPIEQQGWREVVEMLWGWEE